MKSNKKMLVIVGIAAVLLVGLMLLLIFLPKGGSDDTATYDEGIQMESLTDDNGVHQIKIVTDKNGNIENNSYGTLMEYVPADISTIHIENGKGTLDILSETPTDSDGKTEATKYTIVGYEDYAIQSGIPDEIASSASSLSFKKVATLDKSRAGEYGFDNPRSTVTVTYTDKTKAVITVGDNAPQASGTYIKFGSSDAIYLVDTDSVSSFDYGLTDLMSLTINDSASDSDKSQASSITISGSAFPDDIVLEPNSGGKTSASYVIKEPVQGYANESESSNIEGAIRGLYADSVKMVDPSASQLADLGLAEPYAEVKAVYSDATVDVLSSKPDSDGKVYVMLSGGKVVYEMDSSKLPWVTTSYEKLISEYVLYPKLTALSGLSIKTGGKSYDFELSSKKINTTDDKGNETSSIETVIKYDDREIASEKFSTFYDAVALIELADAKSDNTIGDQIVSITYTYESDNSADTVKYYKTSGDRYAAELNGTIVGHVHQSAINRLSSDVNELIKKAN